MSIADKLTTIAENEQRVFEAGKKSEYDKFWDAYQSNGTLTNYIRCFQGYFWDKDNFFPKYDICPSGDASNMFYAWEVSDTMPDRSFDLQQRLEDCGVRLDTSKATNMTNAFAYGRAIKRLPTIDVTGLTNASNSMFGYSNIITIDKIIVDESTPIGTWFGGISNTFANVTFEGVIGANMTITSSGLTHDSLISIINALKNFTDGTTKTLTIGATNLAKLTDAEKAIATQKGWTLA